MIFYKLLIKLHIKVLNHNTKWFSKLVPRINHVFESRPGNSSWGRISTIKIEKWSWRISKTHLIGMIYRQEGKRKVHYWICSNKKKSRLKTNHRQSRATPIILPSFRCKCKADLTTNSPALFHILDILRKNWGSMTDYCCCFKFRNTWRNARRMARWIPAGKPAFRNISADWTRLDLPNYTSN